MITKTNATLTLEMKRSSLKFSSLILVAFILFLSHPSLTTGYRSNVGVFTGANGDQIIFSNSVPYLNSALKVSAVISKFTADAEDCQALCLNNPRCLSVNVAITLESEAGGHLCQLLPTTKTIKPDHFRPSDTFHHFHMVVSVSFPYISFA